MLKGSGKINGITVTSSPMSMNFTSGETLSIWCDAGAAVSITNVG